MVQNLWSQVIFSWQWQKIKRRFIYITGPLIIDSFNNNFLTDWSALTEKHCALSFEEGRHIETVFKLYSSAFRAVGQTVGEKTRARRALTPSYNGLGFMSGDIIQKRKKRAAYGYSKQISNHVVLYNKLKKLNVHTIGSFPISGWKYGQQIGLISTEINVSTSYTETKLFVNCVIKFRLCHIK